MTFCVTFLGYYVNTKTVTVQPGAVLLRLVASLRMQIALSHAKFTLSYVLAQRCVQGLPELLLRYTYSPKMPLFLHADTFTQSNLLYC